VSEKRIYGIDLGTTYSCIAVVGDLGKPEVINNVEGESTTPSVVLFEEEGGVVVGSAAKSSAKMYPERTVAFIKRQMGNSDFSYAIGGKSSRPEEISSFILRKLVKDASEQRGEAITDVIITCPAYFGMAEKEATSIAGELAGLKVHRVISEPAAAALFYGAEKGLDEVVLVYDLGGGTFDITLIEVKGGDVHVIHTDGNHTLGGKDWDDRMLNYLAQEFVTQHADKGDPRDDATSNQELSLKAEDLKKRLTSREKVPETVTHGGERARVEVTRQKQEEITADLLEQTIELTEKVIKAGKDKGVTKINKLLLVGGSSFMPAVATRLKAAFGLDTEMFEPNLAVAKGAAIAGAKMVAGEVLRETIAGQTGQKAEDIDLEKVDARTLEAAAAQAAKRTNSRLSAKDFATMATGDFVDVCSKGFGVVVMVDDRGTKAVEFLIHGNTRVPVEVTQQFGTFSDNQTNVLIQVMEQAGQSESPDLEHNKMITDGLIDGLPPLKAGSPIEVKFHLSADGRLAITAREPTSGKDLTLQVTLEGVMTRSEVERSKGALARVAVA
jgi:molecular chaperone DnaK (HSP70)